MSSNKSAKDSEVTEDQLKLEECKTCKYYQAYIKNYSEHDSIVISAPTVKSQAENLCKNLVPFVEKLTFSKCSYEEIQKILGLSCNSFVVSINDIIKSISFNGVSKNIIKLYLTREGLGDNSIKYSQDPPDNDAIEIIVDCIKKDLTLLFIKEAFDTLINYTQQERYSNKLDDELLRKAKQVLYVDNMNEFQNLFIDYLDSNDYLTDLSYSTIKQFFEDFTERFEMEIPEICCSRYFDTLHDNLERYIKTSGMSEFRLILDPSKRLEAIDAIEMPDVESKNFSKLKKELLQIKQYLSYMANSNSDKIHINNSFVLYLYNNDCRLIDILFMAFCSSHYGYCEYYTENDKNYSSFKKKTLPLVDELNKLTSSLNVENEIDRIQQLINNMMLVYKYGHKIRFLIY